MDEIQDKERLQTEYVRSALHYYITARFATINALVPLAGNLAHHAVELFLKAALLKNTTEKERKDKLRHDLPNIWERYKALMNKAELNKFDQTIADLDKFEGIRYPERIMRLGMTLEAGFVRNPAPVQHAGMPRYELALEELDELVQLIFKLARLNPGFYTTMLYKEDGLRYLNNQNKTPLSPAT
jgi:HEPN domain-containing protein